MKKILLLVFCLQCVVGPVANAQVKNALIIDSLKKKLTAAVEDSNRVNALLALAGEIRNAQPDSALALSIDALHVSQKINWLYGKALAYHFIGTTYGMRGNFDESVSNLNLAITVWDSLEKATSDEKLPSVINLKSRSYGNLGMVSWRKKDNAKALEYDFESVALDKKSGNTKTLALHLANIGRVYESMQRYDSAMSYELNAMDLYKTIADTNGIATVLGYLGNLNLDKKNYPVAEKYLLQAVALSYATEDLYGAMELNEQLSGLYTLMKKYDQSLIYYKRAMSTHDTLFKREQEAAISQKELIYQYREKELAAKLEREKKETRERYTRNSIIAGLIVSLFISVLMYTQRNKIRKEKKRSEELLLNILPQEVAEELKVKGKAIPKSHDMVTVLFTDFKGFTSISEKVSANNLVEELNWCFSAFDLVMGKYNIEKIKTIGDAYMCASGLYQSDTHATDMVKAAFEIIGIIAQRKAEKLAKGEIPFELRIGIHSGPVVSGVVGLKKYSYDIWGDTVNIAARMEQNSEVGRINISESTFRLIGNDFSCEHRGKLHAKNKGEIDMYFINNPGDA